MSKEIKIGKKYFIKIGGAAYENNQGQVRRVFALTPHGCWKYEIQNICNGVQTSYQDCVNFEDLIPLKDFKYQVGDKIKVKKSYVSMSTRKDGKELAGTEQTILRIEEFDSELPVLITAPEGYEGSFYATSSYWVNYKDIKIVSRPLK